MGLFGRRRRQDDVEDYDENYDDGYDYGDEYDDRRRGRGGDAEYEVVGGDLFDGAGPGPWDEEDAPDDGLNRLDLGSVRIPVPEGAQLQVEMDQSGPVKAVHVVTPVGQVTVTAYAAPRTGGLWHEVSTELATQLQQDGATVRSSSGDWGLELQAALGEMCLRFVGVDGPRWMLRGVVAGPPEQVDASAAALYDLMRGTVVVRGSQPMPVRAPLPIELPPAIAEHIQSAQGGA